MSLHTHPPPQFPQIVLGLTEPSGWTLTVGALRRYWRKECFIPSPEGLLLRNPEGLKVARFPRPRAFDITGRDLRPEESLAFGGLLVHVPPLSVETLRTNRRSLQSRGRMRLNLRA